MLVLRFHSCYLQLVVVHSLHKCICSLSCQLQLSIVGGKARALHGCSLVCHTFAAYHGITLLGSTAGPALSKGPYILCELVCQMWFELISICRILRICIIVVAPHWGGFSRLCTVVLYPTLPELAIFIFVMAPMLLLGLCSSP